MTIMDRKEYLQKCKECAMITEEGLFRIKLNVPERLQVEYNGAKYYPWGYELSFNTDGSVRHIAILHALKANSVCHVFLQDVK